MTDKKYSWTKLELTVDSSQSRCPHRDWGIVKGVESASEWSAEKRNVGHEAVCDHRGGVIVFELVILVVGVAFSEFMDGLEGIREYLDGLGDRAQGYALVWNTGDAMITPRAWQLYATTDE